MANKPDQNTSSKAENEQSREQYPRATFAGGCFWGTEYVFGQVPGVKSTAVGFMGGRVDNPTYRQICYTDTNHAEVVQLRYDPKQISYEKLVKVFFKTHDPTTLNRQGADAGTQYRSVIYYQNDEQKSAAEVSIAEVQKDFDAAIVTELSAAPSFYAAEAYHQNYYDLNQSQGYCQVVIAPKVQKFMTVFTDKLA